jgi:pimeloyl-ACP methyl ester carboxylesterase
VAEHVDVSAAQLCVRHGGDGPALLLLHGGSSSTSTVACPVLVLWSTKDDLADLYGDPFTG